MIKCIYQNRRATVYIGSYLGALGSNEYVILVEAMKYRLLEIFEASDHLNNLSDDDRRDLLDMNMALRNIYTSIPYCRIMNFDDHFTPIVGWKRYYVAMENGEADE